MNRITRKAKPEDLDSIYLMGIDVWADGSSENDYLEECRSSSKYKRGDWFVLQENGKLMSSLITYPLNKNSFGIGSIATPEELRQRGYASTLITSVISLLENERPIAFLYSDINPGFYERFGFKRLPDAAQRYKTTVCMTRGATPEEFVNADQTPEYF